MRDISSGFEILLDERHKKIFYMVQAEFPSGNVNLFTGRGTIEYNGETFIGSADLLSCGEIEETSALEAKGTSYTLSGTSEENVSLALSENYTGRSIRQWLGLYAPDGSFEVYQIFEGFMDAMPISFEIEGAAITVKCENEMMLLKKAVGRKYTYEDQRIDFPDDEGFDSVSTITDVEINWGR